MRTARLVGLSQDGQFLIVATDSGEELAIATDDRLRAAMRGDRPRLGQLEIEMETTLSPRDIQTRIRAGASLEEVARVAGLPMDRVERFAAPVLAERSHVAGQAMSGSVRRKGETSGHRSLRITVTERLLTRGVDIDTIDWDSRRLEDGRWEVTADYRSGEAPRHAAFLYDLRGRFSVAGNDEGRWLLGEQSVAKGPQPGRRRPQPGPDEDDTEPTLDLNDELALIRAIQEPRPAADPVAEAAEPTIAVPRLLRPVPAPEPERPEAESDDDSDALDGLNDSGGFADAPGGLDTLDEILGGDGYSEDSVRVYAGLSDASAVPDTAAAGGWEPAIVVNYPVEPSVLDDADESGRDEAHITSVIDDLEDEPPGTDTPGPPESIVDLADRIEEASEFETEHAEHAAALVVPVPEPVAVPAPKPARRKRASVPSWDEIMFGGPKRP